MPITEQIYLQRAFADVNYTECYLHPLRHKERILQTSEMLDLDNPRTWQRSAGFVKPENIWSCRNCKYFRHIPKDDVVNN